MADCFLTATMTSEPWFLCTQREVVANLFVPPAPQGGPRLRRTRLRRQYRPMSSGQRVWGCSPQLLRGSQETEMLDELGEVAEGRVLPTPLASGRH